MVEQYHIKVGGTQVVVPAGYENRKMRRYKKHKGIK